MAVRSSPRLRAIYSSSQSGKQAVFVPCMTKITSDKSLGKGYKRSTDHPNNVKSLLPSSTKCKQERKRVVLKTQSNSLEEKSEHNSTRTRPSRTCALRASSLLEASQSEKQGVLKSAVSAESCSKSTQNHERNGSGSVEDRGAKPGGDHKVTKLETPTFEHSSGLLVDNVSNGVTVVATTSGTTLNVKRKRGRPPKHPTAASKKPKILSEMSPSIDSSLPRLKVSQHVIDLTCDNETVSDEVDAAIFVPSSSTSPQLTQSKITRFLPTTSFEQIIGEEVVEEGSTMYSVGEESASGKAFTEDSGCFRHSLHSDESIAHLFDISCKQDKHDRDCANNAEVMTIPSLRRSKQMFNLVAKDKLDKSLCLEESLSHDNSEDVEPMSSPTEEEYPQPSTPQQKLIRRLARQRQLEEMRAKEAALLREERLLRRKGMLPDSNTTSQSSSTKRISWKDETDLVEIFIYSPVHDDDDDTVSINSDDQQSMDIKFPV